MANIFYEKATKEAKKIEKKEEQKKEEQPQQQPQEQPVQETPAPVYQISYIGYLEIPKIKGICFLSLFLSVIFTKFLMVVLKTPFSPIFCDH